jgi:poly-gamma-glutamate capsule biosynthesis protein CapA/YwtB (metallophosphatase superfamily)
MKRPFLVMSLFFLLSAIVAADPEIPTDSSVVTPQPETESIILTAGGDIKIHSIDGLVLKDLEYPWKGTIDILKRATVLVGNLEVPLSKRGSVYTKKTWILRADPRTVDSLVIAGFDVLTLANNHIMDYGPIALQDTFAALDNAKIARAGAGMNRDEARQPAILTTPDGVKFAFLSYSLTYPEIFWANSSRPGTPYGDPSFFIPDIKKAKTLVDHVVVSFHWSAELQYYPSAYQKNYGRLAIDAGASVVLGHHPHVLQGIEIYKDGLIAYSLGNYVFGSYSKRVKDSIILEIDCTKDSLIQAKLYPINVLNPEVQFNPQLRRGDDAQRVLNDVRTYSSQFKTDIESQGDVGVIKIGK